MKIFRIAFLVALVAVLAVPAFSVPLMGGRGREAREARGGGLLRSHRSPASERAGRPSTKAGGEISFVCGGEPNTTYVCFDGTAQCQAMCEQICQGPCDLGASQI